jgi:hypothetical protein
MSRAEPNPRTAVSFSDCQLAEIEIAARPAPYHKRGIFLGRVVAHVKLHASSREPSDDDVMAAISAKPDRHDGSSEDVMTSKPNRYKGGENHEQHQDPPPLWPLCPPKKKTGEAEVAVM